MKVILYLAAAVAYGWYYFGWYACGPVLLLIMIYIALALYEYFKDQGGEE